MKLIKFLSISAFIMLLPFLAIGGGFLIPLIGLAIMISITFFAIPVLLFAVIFRKTQIFSIDYHYAIDENSNILLIDKNLLLNKHVLKLIENNLNDLNTKISNNLYESKPLDLNLLDKSKISNVINVPFYSAEKIEFKKYKKHYR